MTSTRSWQGSFPEEGPGGPSPQGVEACLRENGEAQYLFLQNFSGRQQQVSLPQGYASLEGEPVKRPPWPPMTARCFAGKSGNRPDISRGEAQN